jgi:hypothetical protein
MTQRDYFLTIQTPEGQRTVTLHVESGLEALRLWTDAVEVAQGTNSARYVDCWSTELGDATTKQSHWQITLYPAGVF